VDQQVQPLQQSCRFLLVRPIVRPTPSVRTERAHRKLCQSPLRPDAGRMPERPGPSRPGRCWFGQRASIKGWSGGWVEVGLGQVPVVVTDEPSQHPALLVTVVEVDVRDALSQAPSAAYPPPYRANAHGSASPAEGRKPLVTAGRNPESAILRRQRFRTPAVGASMVCRRQLCGRPCWHWRRPRRPALPIRDHGGPATYGYLRHPCRRGLPGRRDPDTTQRPPSQTVSTSEHATTPEHPCPGVVARTGPQAVKPSPVSGESMTSGGCACGRASRHQPHRGTPPTLPALQREVATDPRWPVTAASGPGAPSSPGPHPNRAGGGDNNPVHGADGQQGGARVRST
jgi:hypothetical protein